jgi:hypothetical protein
MTNLAETAQALVAEGKGILAADESTGTIKKRFDSIGVESTEDNRRDYRTTLFTTPGAALYISGVILFDETLRQSAADGSRLVDILTQQGIIPGIKVDVGAKPLAGHPDETVTEGLDGLRERAAEFASLGARFTKWRAVYRIGEVIPTAGCITANAHALARYAALAQEAGLVPIVEPEVLMDGPHDIETCEAVTEEVLRTVYGELALQDVELEGTGRGDPAGPEADRAGGGAGHRVPLRRPVGRGGDPAPQCHEQDRRRALEAQLLLRPRAPGRALEGLGRQGGERPGGPERLPGAGQGERRGDPRRLRLRHGITLF